MGRPSLEGTSVIISGAGGLLGGAFTLEILRRGGTVIALDSDPRKLETLKKMTVHTDESRVHFFAVDIADEPTMASLFQHDFPKLSPSALVNNAAINPKVEGAGLEGRTIHDYRYEDFQVEMQVGLYSAMSLSRLFAQSVGSPDGRYLSIINVGSDYTHLSPKQSLYENPRSQEKDPVIKPVGYNIVKHGVHGLTRYLATYYASQGVVVNTLSPGGVLDGQPDWFLKNLENEIPLGRLALKEEIAFALCALLSGDFTYMTGQEIVVDGGRAIW